MAPLDPASVDGFAANEKGGAQHLGLKLLRLAAEGLVCWSSRVAVETEALIVGTGIESLGGFLGSSQ